MTNIHPSAIIDSTAVIADNVEIGPYSVVGANVKIDSGVKICSSAILENCEIGENTTIFSNAVIGTAPQDFGYKGEPTKAIITTRHQISGTDQVHLLGLSEENSYTLMETESSLRGITISEEKMEMLYQRTGGVPLAIVWTIAKMKYLNTSFSALYFTVSLNFVALIVNYPYICWTGHIASLIFVKINFSYFFQLAFAQLETI